MKTVPKCCARRQRLAMEFPGTAPGRAFDRWMRYLAAVEYCRGIHEAQALVKAQIRLLQQRLGQLATEANRARI